MNLGQWLRETFRIVRPTPPSHVCEAIAAQESLAVAAEVAAADSRAQAEKFDQLARFVRTVQGRRKIDEKATETKGGAKR